MERCKMENVAESTNDVSESWMILFLIKKRNTKVSLYLFYFTCYQGLIPVSSSISLLKY